MTRRKMDLADPPFSFRDFGPAEVTAIVSHLRDLYAQVYAEPPYYEGPDDVADFVTRFAEQRREVGFRLTSGWSDGQLVGYLYGFTLDPRRDWWKTLLLHACPGESIEQLRKPTAFISELLVRADVRRRGIGRTLHRRFLASRTEQQALLLAHPDAHAARTAYSRWGWHKVGYGEPFPGAGSYETLVLDMSKWLSASVTS